MSDLLDDLHRYGDALDALIDDGLLSAIDEEGEPARKSRRSVVMATAASLIVIGGLAAALTVRSDSTTDSVTDTAVVPTVVPILPAPGSDAYTVGLGKCDAAWRETWALRASVYADVELPSQPVGLAAIPIPADPGSMRVALRGGRGVFSCTVPIDPASDQGASNESIAVVDSATPVDPGELVILDSGSTSASETGEVGPGTYDVQGRYGSDVTSIEVVLPDGTTAPAGMNGGWFYAEIDVPRDVPLGEERLAWTLADGTPHSGRADVFDRPTANETCAADIDCLSNRLGQLHAHAVEIGDELQMDALEDRQVTDAEYRAVLRRYIACLNDEGIDAALGDGLNIELNGDTFDAEVCSNVWPDLVDEARELLIDAGRPGAST